MSAPTFYPGTEEPPPPPPPPLDEDSGNGNPMSDADVSSLPHPEEIRLMRDSYPNSSSSRSDSKPSLAGQKTIKIPIHAVSSNSNPQEQENEGFMPLLPPGQRHPSNLYHVPDAAYAQDKPSSAADATVIYDGIPSQGEEDDEDDESDDESIDYAAEARKHGIQYSITQVPPLPLTILLGCQHALTLLGGLVLIPLTIVPLMGGTPEQAAEMIGTIYFVMGINTFIQATFGNRLPIFQVTSFSYLPPTISIINNTQLRSIEDPNERFKQTIQVISGSILVAGFVQMALGYSGVVVPMLKYISPVTIASVTIAIGLGYYDVGFSKVATCFPMGLTMMLLAVVCSQFLKPTSLLNEDDDDEEDEEDDELEEEQDYQENNSEKVAPLAQGQQDFHPPRDVSLGGSGRNGEDKEHLQRPRSSAPKPKQTPTVTLFGGMRFFLSLLPILMAMTFTGSLSAILTAFNVWEEGSACRTDGARDLIEEVPFLRIPYPGQWHGFRFELYGIIPMMGAVVASMIESVGHYYTCARVSGAPPPTPGIISRGLAAEGIGVMMAGLYGTGSGVTSSSGNIGVIALTGVGSRAVVQVAALIMIVAVGMMGKVSAALAALPSAIVGGMFCVVLAVLVAVGLSNLQYISLRNDRNLFIIGFSVFNCLSIAGPGGYFSTLDENPFGDTAMGRIALALFSSPMVIAVILSFTLDNTIPGTEEERGLSAWSKAAKNADIHNDPQYVQAYSLPPFWAKLCHNCSYLEFFHRGSMPIPPVQGNWEGSRGDLGELFWTPRHRRNGKYYSYSSSSSVSQHNQRRYLMDDDDEGDDDEEQHQQHSMKPQFNS